MHTDNSPERFQSAAVLLRSADDWILQHRDDKKGIAQPGAVGLWGGRAENESPLDNALRELREETGLRLPPEQLEHITEVSYKLGVTCVNGTIETRQIDATLFLAHQGRIGRFKPTEGQGIIYLSLPELFLPNPTAPFDKTIELDLIIGQLAQDRHPAYEEALNRNGHLATG